MRGFFQEDNGNYSIMRLMCLTSLLASIGFGGASIARDSQGARDLSFYFCTMALTGKVAQKFAEAN